MIWCSEALLLLRKVSAYANDRQVRFSEVETHFHRRAHLLVNDLCDVSCTGEEYLRSTHAQLLRASLLQHDLVQRGAPAAPQGQRQGRGPHANDKQSRFGESRFNATEERIFL